MGTNNVDIQIKNTVAEAPDYKQGLNGGEGFGGASLERAIIVRNGTVGGNDTVDLQFVAADGKKYVAMVTARILRSIVLCTNVAHE